MSARYSPVVKTAQEYYNSDEPLDGLIFIAVAITLPLIWPLHP